MSRFFSADELACGCRRPECDAAPIDMTFIFKIDGLRTYLGIPLHCNSARRCDFWNRHKGGKENSQHKLGKAIDLQIPNDATFWRVVRYCVANGLSFGRISQGAIHIDGRDGVPKFFFYPA